MFTIPSGIFNTYKDVCDELINNENIGENVTLIYPTLTQPNLASGPTLASGGSNRVGFHGGPSSFNPDAGLVTKQVISSETIRVRKYHNPNDWRRYVSLNVPNAKVLIIGKIIDMPKLQRAKEIHLLNDEANFGTFRFRLAGQPFFWGLNKGGRHHYFAAFLETI